MLRSMTGFGAATATVEGEQLSVEIRAINQKFIDVKVRLPRELTALELEVVRTVKAALSRGSVEVQISRRALRGNAAVAVDLPLAKEYARAFGEMQAALGVKEPLPVHSIFEAEGVRKLEERAAALEPARQALSVALDRALHDVVAMREKEGAALAADLKARLKLIAELVEQTRAAVPKALEEHGKKLAARVAELLKRPVDGGRLEQEIALLVDRTDVAEELTRLASHLDQFTELLGADAPAGRRLDFLVQEIHRECTTLANKSQSVEISRLAVDLKVEAERVREQVQNIE